MSSKSWAAISEALDRNAAGELSAADVCGVGFDLQEQLSGERLGAGENGPEYNGHANYETWAASLWLSNDYGLHMEVDSLVSDEAKRACERSAELGLSAPSDGGAFAAAEALREYVTEQHTPDLGGCLADDLLGHALARTDWYAIAAGYIEEAAERDAEAGDEGAPR